MVGFRSLICCRTFVREVTTPKVSSCDTNALCLSDKVALLSNVRQGLIDPDTPSSAKTKTAADGTKMNLVVGFAAVLFIVFELICGSFLTSSTLMDAHFMTVMIRTFKQWIFGMVSLRISNGTTQMLYRQLMEPSTSNSMLSKTTTSTTDLEWFSHGINCVSKVVDWRPVFRYLVVETLKGFGPVSGLWAILEGLVILRRRMVRGHTVTGISAMLVLRRIKVLRTDSVYFLECVCRLAPAAMKIILLLAILDQHPKSMLLKQV